MTKPNKRIIKIILWAITALLVLILFFCGFVYLRTEQILKQKIAAWINEESNQLYQLSFDDVKFKLFPLTVIFEEIDLTTNPEALKNIKDQSPSKVLYEFHAKSMKFEAINWREFRKNQILHGKNLSIYKPELKLTGENILEPDSVKTTDKLFQSIQPIFKKTLNKVVFDEINLIDANYEIYASPVDILKVSNAKNISLTIKNFITDSSMIFNESKLFDSDDIILKMNNFSNNLGDNLHTFSIDTLAFSLKTGDISAYGFHLSHHTKKTNKNLFEVFVPQLKVKSKNIARFAINDTLDFDYLEFNNAKIEFFQKENPEKININELSQFDLYALIDNQFTEIKADSFRLRNATIEIYHQPDYDLYQQHFNSVDVLLYDFKLDSLSSSEANRLFHASEIEMEVSEYHLRLEDKMHEFMAESLYVSTISNTLGAQNIKVSPLSTAEENIRNIIRVNCKKIDIDQVNLKTIYHKRILPTKSITIVEPKVNLSYKTEFQKQQKPKETGLLFDLVQAYLQGVYADVVIIDNGNLRIDHSQFSQVLGYFEAEFHFALAGFSLDSASVEKTDKFFYATDFDLRFSDYEMKLIDNLHRLHVDSIAILSTDRKLEITNLSLQPTILNVSKEEMKALNKSELYKIFVPRITLQGILLKDAFFHNKLSMNSFQIVEPKIYFENFGVLNQNNPNREFQEFYQLIFNYINDFNIKNIAIPNGEFTWVNHTRKGKTISFDNAFSAELKNFRLNENELDKKQLLFSENFDISLMNQNFLLSDSVHVLHAGEIKLSTLNKSISVKNASFYPDINSKKYDQLSTTYQFAIPAFILSNIDFSNAYWNKDLLLKNLAINDPKFRIYSKKGSKKSLDLNKFKIPMPAEINSIKINELTINNGQVITYETEGKNQEVGSTFNINLFMPEVVFESDTTNRISLTTSDFFSRITNFTTTLSNNHKVEIESVDFERKKQQLTFTNLNVIPTGPINQQNTFSVNVPRLHFYGFDINTALEKNHFIFDEITVTNPIIDIKIIDSIKGDKYEFTKNLNLYPYINPFIDQLKINRLRLNNVDLGLNWFEKKLVDRKFNVAFNDILINETQRPENFLHASEFEISTTKLQTESKNGMYHFSADSLIFNSVKHNVLLKNIAIKPLLNLEEFNRKSVYQTDYTEVSTSHIELKGLDEKAWLQNNIIDADSIIIGQTNASILRNKRLPFNVNQRPPWPQDLLLNIKQPFVFDALILKPSTLIYSELMEFSDEPGQISFNQLHLKSSRITNIKKLLNENSQFTVWAGSHIMNQSLLSATFEFDLTDKNYSHKVIGKLEPVSMIPFNAIVEKSAPFSIETGQINRFEFNISLDNENASGELIFSFDNFKINVLDINEEEIKKLKFATFWANTMVLNTQYPKGNVELQPILINYTRDEQRSVINYWWKSIYTAAKHAIGIKNEE